MTIKLEFYDFGMLLQNVELGLVKRTNSSLTTKKELNMFKNHSVLFGVRVASSSAGRRRQLPRSIMITPIFQGGYKSAAFHFHNIEQVGSWTNLCEHLRQKTFHLPQSSGWNIGNHQQLYIQRNQKTTIKTIMGKLAVTSTKKYGSINAPSCNQCSSQTSAAQLADLQDPRVEDRLREKWEMLG